MFIYVIKPNDNLGKIAIIKLLDYNSLNYVAILEVNDDI